MAPAGCRWTNTAPSSRAIIACPAMPMYGSSTAGLPSRLATVNVRDASRFTTSAESPRCHVIVDPSLSTAESVFPLPASLFPDSATFEADLPPLPPGGYRVYADIVHESGFAQTLDRK